eukprot:jgi/Chlat1/7612/Chrsp64S00558
MLAVASALSIRLLRPSSLCVGGLSRQQPRTCFTSTSQAASQSVPRTEAASQQRNNKNVVDAHKHANNGDGSSGAETQTITRTPGTAAKRLPAVKQQTTSLITVTKPLPRASFLTDDGGVAGDNGVTASGAHEQLRLREGTGGKFKRQLQPGSLLQDILTAVPQLRAFANLDVEVVFNRDSCRVGPPEWVKLAKLLHARRDTYDAFLVVHGTDTMAFTAAALSLMLPGFRKPVVLTGSQLPLAEPRSDARQNLIDSITCATAQNVPFQEVAVCFGGLLMRGNRAQKTHASHYQAFSSPNFSPLAQLGVDVYLTSQCKGGTLHPELYRSGSIALEMGVESAQPQMTPECASVKMMLCLSYPDIPLAQPLAGEL